MLGCKQDILYSQLFHNRITIPGKESQVKILNDFNVFIFKVRFEFYHDVLHKHKCPKDSHFIMNFTVLHFKTYF